MTESSYWIRQSIWFSGIFCVLHFGAMGLPHLWGVDMVSFLPVGAQIGFAICGLVLLFENVRNRILDGISFLSGMLDQRIWFLILLLGSGILFWLFKIETHLLGDGALYVRELDRGVYRAMVRTDRAPLAFWVLRQIYAGVGDAVLTVRFYSMGSGLIYIGLVPWAACVLGANRVSRAVIAGCLLTGGFVQLFFGYGETYSLLLPVILLFVITGMRTLDGGSLAWPVVCAGVVAALHVSQVLLWPSLLVLLYSRLGWRRIGSLLGYLGLLGGVFMGLLFGVGVSPWKVLFSSSHALLPVFADPGFHQPYRLFSFWHGLDVLNVILLSVPVVAIVGCVVVGYQVRSQVFSFLVRSGKNAFLMTAALFPVLFVCAANFEIGAFRDWDVQAVCLFPLLVWAAFGLTHLVADQAVLAQVGMLVCGMSLLHTGFWLGVNTQAEAAEMRFESALSHQVLSSHARSYGWETLAEHFRKNMDIDRMFAAYEKTLQANPDNPRLWALVGDMHFKLGHYEDAVAAFQEATTRNPNLNQAFLLMGNAYYQLGKFKDALASYRLALERKPDDLDAIYNITEVYRVSGDVEHTRLWSAKYDSLSGVDSGH